MGREQGVSGLRSVAFHVEPALTETSRSGG